MVAWANEKKFRKILLITSIFHYEKLFGDGSAEQ